MKKETADPFSHFSSLAQTRQFLKAFKSLNERGGFVFSAVEKSAACAQSAKASYLSSPQLPALMSSAQRHRGQHSNDARLFSPQWLPRLNQAVADLSWLMSRGYPDEASLRLVGDRYRLEERQRRAVQRASCPDEALARRRAARCAPAELEGRRLLIDGYNLLITIESALSGGILLDCRDSAFRDIASVHGTYRSVKETLPALTLIGLTIRRLGPAEVCWLLDSPISNSGRLRALMRSLSDQHQFGWQVELVSSPDKALAAEAEAVAISSDSWVLDHARQWFNLHQHIAAAIPQACVLTLHGAEGNIST